MKVKLLPVKWTVTPSVEAQDESVEVVLPDGWELMQVIGYRDGREPYNLGHRALLVLTEARDE